MSLFNDGAKTITLVPRVLTGRLSTYTNDIAVTVNLRAQVGGNEGEGRPSITVDESNHE